MSRFQSVAVQALCIAAACIASVAPFSITPASFGASLGNAVKSSITVNTNANINVNANRDPRSIALHATWSDSRAVRDYQEFLSSGKQEPDRKEDVPSVIIRPFDGQGNLELAEALHRMGDGNDLVLTPDQHLPPDVNGNPEYPIYVTLPPQQIAYFIQNLPASYEERYDDFVFFSGGLVYGNIEDVLREYGYCRDSMTQCLITGLKMTPAKSFVDVGVSLGTDAMGEEKWAGRCTACGKWNGAIAQRLQRHDVHCDMDFYRDWRRRMWERCTFDAVFHLIGAVRDEATTLADVGLYYENEVSDMVWEVSMSLRGWKAITLLYGFEQRLSGMAAQPETNMQCMVDESMYPFIWGNRVFTECKMISEYMWFAREQKGLFASCELPPQPSDGEEMKSIMRQGNMRADGVI